MGFWTSIFSVTPRPPRPGASNNAWQRYFASLTDEQLLALGEEGFARLRDEDYRVSKEREARRGGLLFGKVGFCKAQSRLQELTWRRRYEQAMTFLESATNQELSSLAPERVSWLISSLSSKPPTVDKLHQRRCAAIAERECAVVAAVVTIAQEKLDRILTDAEDRKREFLSELATRNSPQHALLLDQIAQVTRAIDHARASALPEAIIAAEVSALEARREQLRHDAGTLQRFIPSIDAQYTAALDQIRTRTHESFGKTQRSAEATVTKTANKIAGYCSSNIGRILHRELFPSDQEAKRRADYEALFSPTLTRASKDCREFHDKMRRQWLHSTDPS